MRTLVVLVSCAVVLLASFTFAGPRAHEGNSLWAAAARVNDALGDVVLDWFFDESPAPVVEEEYATSACGFSKQKAERQGQKSSRRWLARDLYVEEEEPEEY